MAEPIQNPTPPVAEATNETVDQPDHPVHHLSAGHPLFGASIAGYDFFLAQQRSIDTLQETIAQLRLSEDRTNQLQASIEQLRTQQVNTSTISYQPRVKPHEPDTFHDVRSKLCSFITSLRIYISFNSTRFTTERSNVLLLVHSFEILPSPESILYFEIASITVSKMKKTKFWTTLKISSNTFNKLLETLIQLPMLKDKLSSLSKKHLYHCMLLSSNR